MALDYFGSEIPEKTCSTCGCSLPPGGTSTNEKAAQKLHRKFHDRVTDLEQAVAALQRWAHDQG